MPKRDKEYVNFFISLKLWRNDLSRCQNTLPRFFSLFLLCVVQVDHQRLYEYYIILYYYATRLPLRGEHESFKTKKKQKQTQKSYNKK